MLLPAWLGFALLVFLWSWVAYGYLSIPILAFNLFKSRSKVMGSRRFDLAGLTGFLVMVVSYWSYLIPYWTYLVPGLAGVYYMITSVLVFNNGLVVNLYAWLRTGHYSPSRYFSRSVMVGLGAAMVSSSILVFIYFGTSLLTVLGLTFWLGGLYIIFSSVVARKTFSRDRVFGRVLGSLFG